MEQEQIVKNTSSEMSGGDVLKEFQLSELSVSEKSTKEFGLKIAQKIWGYTSSGITGYYYNRNARFRKNRNYANGRMDIQAMFADRLEMNAKKNYIRLNWQTLQLMNRIISGLIGRWMQRSEKIVVTAIDDLSQSDKQKEYDEIEFLIQNKAKIEALQQQSGIPLMPQGSELPADKDELNLWQTQFQRTPEEVLYELGCNDILQSNGLFDVLKEKLLHDSAEVGFVGTYTYMDDYGIIHTQTVEPEDAIYSYSKFNDFRDTTWRGQAPSLKISTLRRRYGKEFHPNNPLALTEEQLFRIAGTAKEFGTITNLVWDASYTNIYLRPYDEWNVRSIEFELKTVDCDPYKVTKSKLTGTTYTQKGMPVTASGKKKEKPSDNQNIISDSNFNIYRGVYLPDNDMLLEWGIKENMIRPQDPKEVGNAEFSYSFYMYQNYEMRNLAIPEKIEAAVDGMILALLKMQQVVARMRPTGAAIDESALQNIDYGLGDAGNKDVDYKKLYDQTGDIYYRGVDAEGNRVPIPIQELANTGFLGQMDGLIKNYQFNYQALRDELGEDPNLISAALQPRVTGGNVEASQQMADYATDYMYRAYAEVVKMTARKVSCLLSDSVKYGSAAYRNLIKAEDIGERQFSADIKFLPTQAELQRFEALLNQTIATNPEMLSFLDPFRLLRIAKEDLKAGELLFRQAQKKFIAYQKETAAANQKATFDAQMQSGISAEKEKRETMVQEVQMKGQIESMTSKEKQKEIILSGIFAIYGKGLQMPENLKGLEEEILHNLALPLFAENLARMQQVAQGLEQEQQEQMAMQQQEQQQSPQPAMVA